MKGLDEMFPAACNTAGLNSEAGCSCEGSRLGTEQTASAEMLITGNRGAEAHRGLRTKFQCTR